MTLSDDDILDIAAASAFGYYLHVSSGEDAAKRAYAAATDFMKERERQRFSREGDEQRSLRVLRSVATGKCEGAYLTDSFYDCTADYGCGKPGCPSSYEITP